MVIVGSWEKVEASKIMKHVSVDNFLVSACHLFLSPGHAPQNELDLNCDLKDPAPL